MVKYFAILILLLALINTQIFAINKSLCGDDLRIPSKNIRVARLLTKLTEDHGCTGTLIGKSCMISAGHCKLYLRFAEFNTPKSIKGKIQHPEAQDIYEVNTDTIIFRDWDAGNDWAVFKLNKNEISGKYPGEVYGNYEINFNSIENGSILRMTGYGKDKPDPDRNYAQQTSTGMLVNIENNKLKYRVDSTSGNSGSAVVLEQTNQIVGIHNHGGCSEGGWTYNRGTEIANNDALISSIKACLESE